MTLPEILKAIRQWWWVLILGPLIGGVAAFLLSSSMTPIYEAEATTLIEHQMAGGISDLQSIQAAERRTLTFSRLVTTRSVLAPVIEELGLERSVDDLRGSVSVSHVRDTQIATITVTDPDPDHAAELANAIAGQFGKYVQEIQVPILSDPNTTVVDILSQLDSEIAATEGRIAALEADDGPATDEEQLELAQLNESLDQLEQSRSALAALQVTVEAAEPTVGSQVYVVEEAAAPTSPVSPRIVLNTLLALILGLMFAGAVIVGLSWVDDYVKTETDIRSLLERPVIGTVPEVDLPDQMESIHAGRSISGEIFRGLRTNLQFTMVDRNVKSIVVTSLTPGEGKTTVAANLAIVLAQGGQRVILVDADLRRPRIHSLFHRVRNDRGLSNLLLQSPAVIENMVQSTTINNLKVLATGPLPPNPPDLFGSSRMRALVNALEETADIIIFDSPPLAISESLLLSSLADGIVIVVRAGNNRTTELAGGFESAMQTGVPVLGVVLNGVPSNSQAAHRVYEQYYPLVEGDDAEPQPKRRAGWLGRVFSRGA